MGRTTGWTGRRGCRATATVHHLNQAPTIATENTTLEPVEIEGEPRVLDVALAERLGLSRPRDIRKDLIKPNLAELQGFGPLRETPAKVSIGSGAYRTVKAYYLNEEQALLVCMFARTSKAKEVRREVIHVFTAWRRGELTTTEPEQASGGSLGQTIAPLVTAAVDVLSVGGELLCAMRGHRNPCAAFSARPLECTRQASKATGGLLWNHSGALWLKVRPGMFCAIVFNRGRSCSTRGKTPVPRWHPPKIG